MGASCGRLTKGVDLSHFTRMRNYDSVTMRMAFLVPSTMKPGLRGLPVALLLQGPNRTSRQGLGFSRAWVFSASRIALKAKPFQSRRCCEILVVCVEG